MGRPIINNKIPLAVDQELKSWYKKQEKEAYKLVDRFRQKIAGAARKRNKVVDEKTILTDNPTEHDQVALSDERKLVS